MEDLKKEIKYLRNELDKEIEKKDSPAKKDRDDERKTRKVRVDVEQ